MKTLKILRAEEFCILPKAWPISRYAWSMKYSVMPKNIPQRKSDCVYDPCCGGGYSLTVLGFMNADVVEKIFGSDIDARMIDVASKNLALLSKYGLKKRFSEIKDLYDLYGKPSHKDALQSIGRFKDMLKRDIPAEVFIADCTKKLPQISPDIIITDIPYGNLVTWHTQSNGPIYDMLQQLAAISHKDTVLAISMDKKQKVSHPAWIRKKKQIIGKRKFEIYTLGSL